MNETDIIPKIDSSTSSHIPNLMELSSLDNVTADTISTNTEKKIPTSFSLSNVRVIVMKLLQ